MAHGFVHHCFLSRCLRDNSIPSGLKLNFKLALGTNSERLQKRCDRHLQIASKNILTDLIDYTRTVTTELQHSLEEKRKNLFQEHRNQDALNCWNQAKKRISSINRELNIRYRRLNILLCIINHFKINCSNQIKRKWCLHKLYFRQEIMSVYE